MPRPPSVADKYAILVNSGISPPEIALPQHSDDEANMAAPNPRLTRYACYILEKIL